MFEWVSVQLLLCAGVRLSVGMSNGSGVGMGMGSNVGASPSSGDGMGVGWRVILGV